MQEDHGYLCSICQESFGEWAEIKNHTLSKHGGYLTSDTYTGIRDVFNIVMTPRDIFITAFSVTLQTVVTFALLSEVLRFAVTKSGRKDLANRVGLPKLWGIPHISLAPGKRSCIAFSQSSGPANSPQIEFSEALEHCFCFQRVD